MWLSNKHIIILSIILIANFDRDTTQDFRLFSSKFVITIFVEMIFWIWISKFYFAVIETWIFENFPELSVSYLWSNLKHKIKAQEPRLTLETFQCSATRYGREDFFSDVLNCASLTFTKKLRSIKFSATRRSNYDLFFIDIIWRSIPLAEISVVYF